MMLMRFLLLLPFLLACDEEPQKVYNCRLKSVSTGGTTTEAVCADNEQKAAEIFAASRDTVVLECTYAARDCER
jgi:hypothetical protein